MCKGIQKHKENERKEMWCLILEYETRIGEKNTQINVMEWKNWVSEAYIGNLETERHKERCRCHLCNVEQNVLHLLQKRNEAQRWREQFLDNKRLHINEVIAYMKKICNKTQRIKKFRSICTQSKRRAKKLRDNNCASSRKKWDRRNCT